MYVVLKNNKKTVRQTFTTYETARQYVRKLIRKSFKPFERSFWDTSNPMIGDYGYSIKRV